MSSILIVISGFVWDFTIIAKIFVHVMTLNRIKNNRLSPKILQFTEVLVFLRFLAAKNHSCYSVCHFGRRTDSPARLWLRLKHLFLCVPAEISSTTWPWYSRLILRNQVIEEKIGKVLHFPWQPKRTRYMIALIVHFAPIL